MLPICDRKLFKIFPKQGKRFQLQSNKNTPGAMAKQPDSLLLVPSLDIPRRYVVCRLVLNLTDWLSDWLTHKICPWLRVCMHFMHKTQKWFYRSHFHQRAEKADEITWESRHFSILRHIGKFSTFHVIRRLKITLCLSIVKDAIAAILELEAWSSCLLLRDLPVYFLWKPLIKNPFSPSA